MTINAILVIALLVSVHSVLIVREIFFNFVSVDQDIMKKIMYRNALGVSTLAKLV